MSQRVPSCDVDDNNNYFPTSTKFPLLPNSNFITHEVPMLNYQIGELPCKKGQPTNEEGTIGNLTTWDKPRTNDDTLESIVYQHVIVNNNFNKLGTMDALVPCCSKQGSHKAVELGRVSACMSGCSSRVAYSSEGEARVPMTRELSGSKDLSASVNGSETYPKELSLAFNSASMGSPENTTSSGKHCTETTTNDDRDSFSHRRSLTEARNGDYKTTRVDRSSEESNKRIKASATHNQSERRRRDRINQRMKELQKLVPNSSKSDKVSLLDEVIQYMRQLQAHLQMMNWMKMYSSMILPITMQQQQLKMFMMMTQMSMGMGMNKDMVMNMNGINNPCIPPVLHPNPFMSMPSCGHKFQGPPGKCVSMDAYSRMAALYQQLYNPPASSSKS